MQTARSSWVIVKFGGTSVSSRERWDNITTIIQQHLAQGRRPLIVCSAASQVSNLLEDTLNAALRGEHAEPLEKIYQCYQQLATELEVDFQAILAETFAKLQQLIEGISLVLEASPRVRAQVMAFGELALTKIGAAFLQKTIATEWLDARTLLMTEENPLNSETGRYLSNCCQVDTDQALIKQLEQHPDQTTFITQGFIASNIKQETVLLGRGGSDVSAAYFAVKLNAQRCEIWTDVPGIYTANPHQIAEARFIRALDYDEAQEITAMGAKVLHPNCINPVKQHRIPLHIKFTREPDRAGTIVSYESDGFDHQIKSIQTKGEVFLIEINTVLMWQQVGFLADVFTCFKTHKISIDLISTSENTFTVSLDPSDQQKDPYVMEALLKDLKQFGTTKLIGPCASISLVGRHIRAILHELAPAFKIFSEHNVYLLSQASNDLNLTFVVDEDQAPRLAKNLHHLLIEEGLSSHHFAKSWQQEFGQAQPLPTSWWQQRRAELIDMTTESSPRYIYDIATLEQQADKLLQCNTVNQFFYAMKANRYPDVLRVFYQKGLGFECVSLGEINLILSLFPDIDRQRLLFTPNFAPKEEYQTAFDLGLHVTVDNVFPLTQWPEIFKDQTIILRVDPGQGYGHHKYVCTGGVNSKFGIQIAHLDQVIDACKKNHTTVIGLHSHSGSGILRAETWQETLITLTSLLDDFPDVTTINLGGGLGVVEKIGQQALDLNALDQSLLQVKNAFPSLQLWMEPGRYLVANAGVLLATVTQIKQKGDITFVGIDTGMNSLIRPALYGSYHEIVNLSKLDAPKTQRVNIVGPICETGDTFGHARLFPDTDAGDIILIANTGAYGFCMSSRYNLREPAAESCLDTIPASKEII